MVPMVFLLKCVLCLWSNEVKWPLEIRQTVHWPIFSLGYTSKHHNNNNLVLSWLSKSSFKAALQAASETPHLLEWSETRSYGGSAVKLYDISQELEMPCPNISSFPVFGTLAPFLSSLSLSLEIFLIFGGTFVNGEYSKNGEHFLSTDAELTKS